jgi:hypothetical protein
MPLYAPQTSQYETVPSHNNLKAWSMPLWALGGAGVTPTAGVGYYRRVLVPDAFTIASVHLRVNTAASTQLANTFVGIYNQAGTRIGVSAESATTFETLGTGWKSVAVTADGGQTLSTAGLSYVWVGFVAGTQGTTALILRGDVGGDHTQANLNLTASSPFFMGTLGTGLTALPASITASSMTSNNTFWAGLA